MSKRTTRLGLGAAVVVAIGAVSAGATVSADTLSEPASEAVVSETVIMVNGDGTAIECTIDGGGAGAVVGAASESGEVPESEPIEVESLPGISSEGGTVGTAVVPSADAGEPTAADLMPGGIDATDLTELNPEDIRQGSEAECAPFTGASGGGN